MKANRAFRLIITRGGREPVFLAARDRRDRIEVVSVDDGEPLLYWELPAREAARLARDLRRDLLGMDAEEFLTLWQDADRER
jgi:hypothetical protein